MIEARRRRRRAANGPLIVLELQLATTAATVPDQRFLTSCAAAALHGLRARAELGVRIVDEVEGRALNRRWRGVDAPTNVLSFPLTGLESLAPDLLGDIVICAPLVAVEAAAQGKHERAHWAHLTIHGVLHLAGFDHELEPDAEAMEDRERAALATLGFADPYAA